MVQGGVRGALVARQAPQGTTGCRRVPQGATGYHRVPQATQPLVLAGVDTWVGRCLTHRCFYTWCGTDVREAV